MPCYTVKMKPRTQAQLVRDAGYMPRKDLTTDERRAAVKGAEDLVDARDRIVQASAEKADRDSVLLPDATWFVCGDLGEHCSDPTCADVGEYLCDWPMGDGKTCDLPMCEHHAREVGIERHFCPVHHRLWQAQTAPPGGNPWPRTRST